LAVQMASPTGGKDLTYVQHVDLPKGSTKVVWMTLPGVMLNSSNNTVKFYKGTAGKGTVIPFSGGNDHIETLPSRAIQVGVWARDSDTLNFLSVLNQKGYDVNVVHLKAEDLPDEALMLDGLDLIALNDVASDQLKEDQVKAITTWVERGGSLVLAGGEGYPKTAKAFDAIAPVTYSGTASLDRLPTLEKEGGKELPMTSSFTVSRATVRSGETTVQESGIPLFVKSERAKGKVWYVAYDLSLNPLASWNGNPALWEKVLQGLAKTSFPDGRGPQHNIVNQLMESQYALDLFPSLKPPAFYLLLSLFMGYVILVAPLLYLILKKIDKREWAWVIIPVFSLVSSAGIYLIGASDKNSVLAHTLNTLELNGSGQGVRTSATAVFVPRGGSYELEFSQPVKMIGTNGNFGGAGIGREMTGSSDQAVVMEPGSTRLQWNGVEYWSVRKAWMQFDQSEKLGQFEVTGAMSANGLQGEVTNRTLSDLTNVSLILNRQAVNIGDLKIGEKKSFNLTMSGGQQMHTDFGQLLFPFGNRPDDKERERQMVNNYMNRMGMNGGPNKPILIGWSTDQQSLYKVNGKTPHSDQLNMWVQEVSVQSVQGNKFSATFDSVPPVMTANHVQQYGAFGRPEMALEGAVTP
jgi:hypothetical protein